MARVLVAEADSSLRELLSDALTAAGHEVVTDAPDVAVLDISIADGMAGLRAVPTIAVVSWSEPDAIRLAVDRGAADYVCKPYAVDDLVERVGTLLRTGESQRLEMVIARQAVAARRTGRPFSVVLADVDRFSAVRATHGDDTAAEVLAAVGKRLRLSTRASDVLLHWAGNCFALVLPGADAMAATMRAEQFRAALAGAAIDAGRVAVPLTASFGVAEFGASEHGDETLDRAIDALHAAETAGGDAVRTAESAAVAVP